jgi:mono/diheme cytochrome c family protein
VNQFRVFVLPAFVLWSAVVSLSAQSGATTAAADDQQGRGKSLYMANCASCHQENLKGTTETPPLAGDMFWQNWESYSANNLVVQVENSMPEDNPGGLQHQQYIDIVAYILKTNDVHWAGDLPPDADALKKIRIKKP